MFAPLETPRLTIRPFVLEDVDVLWHRRNDPLVTKYQNWETPFPIGKTASLVASLVAMDGPENDEWWMAMVVDRTTGEPVGELAVHLSWDSKVAEVGYNFDPPHWGKGYAVEALDSLIAYLWEQVGVERVFGMLHPENRASAHVLERCGLVFEGHTRKSYWDGDEVSDDWIYGMTRDEWDAWRNRPGGHPDVVEFVEIDADNARAVARLVTHRSQQSFVAPVRVSYGDALFPEVIDGAPVVPWMRAVEADSELAGFVMIAVTTEAHPEPFLWRLLVDRMHQRRGIGRRILDLVVDECRSNGDTALLTSWSAGRGSPEPFYLAYGFEPTGNIVFGETEGRLVFDGGVDVG